MLGSCFLSIDWLLFGEEWGGVHSKLDLQSQDGGRISDVDGQGVVGRDNWTIFMDIIYVSNCICIIFEGRFTCRKNI